MVYAISLGSDADGSPIVDFVSRSEPTAPPKATDKRSFDDDRTVQCESIDPDDLQALLRGAIEERLDLDLVEVSWSSDSLSPYRVGFLATQSTQRGHVTSVNCHNSFGALVGIDPCHESVAEKGRAFGISLARC